MLFYLLIFSDKYYKIKKCFSFFGVMKMARTTVFQEEMFLEKALLFIQEEGIESLNVRSLCDYIGCSTQPLFKNFINMDEFKKILKNYLFQYYQKFIDEVVEKGDYLFTKSLAYCLFAQEEPNLFKAIFMIEKHASILDLEELSFFSKQYKCTKKAAERIFLDVQFYTHGLACQIACKEIIVTEREIKKLLNNMIKKFIK